MRRSWLSRWYAPRKALFASAFTLAASCFPSSVTSWSRNDCSSCDGGTLVGGEELIGVEDPEDEAALMVV